MTQVVETARVVLQRGQDVLPPGSTVTVGGRAYPLPTDGGGAARRILTALRDAGYRPVGGFEDRRYVAGGLTLQVVKI